MSESDEKEYVSMAVESARQMWGNEELKKIREQVERTAKAVYVVSNYPLGPEIEPITLPKPKEE
jgi:hypothetical protein